MLFFLTSIFYIIAFVFSLLFYYKKANRYLPLLFGISAVTIYFIAVTIKTVEVGGFPFADVYGFYSFLGNFIILILIFFSFVNDQISKFSAVLAFCGFLSTLLVLPSQPSSYKSLLFTSHIILAVISYSSVFFGSFSSLLRFIIESKLKHKEVSGFFLPINTLTTWEKFFLNSAFVMFTFTLVFGSFWARSFIGKHWINDPKLFSTSLIWVYYAFVVHLNIVKTLRPKRVSQLSLLGGVLTIFNLIFIRHEL